MVGTDIYRLLRTRGGTATNVAAAANANVTLTNGEAADEAESLPVVVVVTENGLWDITLNANAKIVIRMAATAENVSNPFLSRFNFSFVLDPCLFFAPCFLHFSTGHLSPPEYRGHRTLKAPATLVRPALPSLILQKKKGKKYPYVPHISLFFHETEQNR